MGGLAAGRAGGGPARTQFVRPKIFLPNGLVRADQGSQCPLKAGGLRSRNAASPAARSAVPNSMATDSPS